MKSIIEIEDNDIKAVKEIMKAEGANSFVQNRIEIINNPKTNLEDFWHAILIGLLSSQQKSGPDSPISKLLSKNPFELSLIILSKEVKISPYALKILKANKGIRFAEKISDFIEFNFVVFSNNKNEIEAGIHSIISAKAESRFIEERAFCLKLQELFKGIGPKQSRNVIQAVGLSKYEIPIDSRFIKWIKNNMNYELPLNTVLLSNEDYYTFTLDIIKRICLKAYTTPAILDANVFSSFDDGKWEEFFKDKINVVNI